MAGKKKNSLEEAKVPELDAVNDGVIDVGQVQPNHDSTETQKEDEIPSPAGKAIGKLTSEQYWEWRTTVAEMRVAELEYKVANHQNSLLFKDVEISKFKAIIHGQTVVTNLLGKSEDAKNEYQKFRKELENKVGCSLEGKIIDDSFVVRELEGNDGPK